mmetsp:Transcript_35291/g.82631  ORF Transcript_35291/g.82631 Transcript_35291/m.82631 type:complete len:236 (-) Transcript_35291:907-1614(-)
MMLREPSTNHGVWGTWRGIWLVLTGCSMGCLRKPKYAPASTRGVEMPSHMQRRAKRVPKGTAPDDFCPQIRRLRTKKMLKTLPGYSIAVHRPLLFHLLPLNMRKSLAEVYPPNIPMKTKRKSAACMSAPLLAGERNPKHAKSIRMKEDTASWTPVPVNTDSQPAITGGLKTSPCTSFHPVSSCPSSRKSCCSYRWKSRRRVRTMIMATRPERKRTIMNELRIENQCTCASSADCR